MASPEHVREGGVDAAVWAGLSAKGVDVKPADSGLWAEWTLWRWAGGDGGGRRSCRLRGTR